MPRGTQGGQCGRKWPACHKMLEQVNEQDATKTVIQVWKEVACQTEPKKGLKEKSMELFSMAELMEVFN